MRRLFFIVLMFGCVAALHAQTTPKIKALEKERNELREQIAESETLLQSTKKDVASQMNNLVLLSEQMAERKKYVALIEKDVKEIQREIDVLQVELRHLQKDLTDKRKKYEQSVKYLYRNKSIQEKLMFIFSADNLSQMYRRLRYVRQYADYQRRQGMQLQRKQEEVKAKPGSLLASRKAKEDLLKQGEEEKKKLEKQEKERKALLASLQRKQKSIQAEITRKRRSAERLNTEIDRMIEQELAESRKKAQEKNKKQGQQNDKPADKNLLAKADAAKEKPASPEAMDAYKVDADASVLSGTFEQNKGNIPMPITGPYVIVGHYGKYQVDGLKNVRLDNKGIDIKGKDGAMARVVFDGEVSAVFQYNGLSNVLVRHGNYISVYCNLSSVMVKKGSQLKARDIIGRIYTDKDNNTILHFQLRKEVTKLNPEVWLRH